MQLYAACVALSSFLLINMYIRAQPLQPVICKWFSSVATLEQVFPWILKAQWPTRREVAMFVVVLQAASASLPISMACLPCILGIKRFMCKMVSSVNKSQQSFLRKVVFAPRPSLGLCTWTTLGAHPPDPLLLPPPRKMFCLHH